MQIRENLNTSELTKSPYSLQTEFSRCTKIYQSQYLKAFCLHPPKLPRFTSRLLTRVCEWRWRIWTFCGNPKQGGENPKAGRRSLCWLCSALPPLHIDHNAYFSVQFGCTLNTAHMHCDAFEYIACCAVCTLPTASCIQCLLCSLQCTCNNI